MKYRFKSLDAQMQYARRLSTNEKMANIIQNNVFEAVKAGNIISAIIVNGKTHTNSFNVVFSASEISEYLELVDSTTKIYAFKDIRHMNAYSAVCQLNLSVAEGVGCNNFKATLVKGSIVSLEQFGTMIVRDKYNVLFTAQEIERYLVEKAPTESKLGDLSEKEILIIRERIDILSKELNEYKTRLDYLESK